MRSAGFSHSGREKTGEKDQGRCRYSQKEHHYWQEIRDNGPSQALAQRQSPAKCDIDLTALNTVKECSLRSTPKNCSLLVYDSDNPSFVEPFRCPDRVND